MRSRRHIGLARRLRSNPTEAERRLWSCLRSKRLDGWRFRRQHPVPPYIVDFACIEARLVVEADGGQHTESRHDAKRDAELVRRGWRVIRFGNHDILNNRESVVLTILAALNGEWP